MVTSKKILEIKIKRDWYDYVMLILVGIGTFSALFGVTIQVPKIQGALENISKSYNASLSERLSIKETFTTCVTHAKTPHITECYTCNEYPIEQINAILRVCNIEITDSLTNTTNKTQKLELIK
ncbi:MAG: hypothetical protein QXS48_00610 [Candidatus Aenigmatarchaeota archaeon]